MSETEGGQRILVPLGDVEEPTDPFQVTSVDITGPYFTIHEKTNTY